MDFSQTIEIAKLFLIPSGLFLAALGAARTEPLKFAVSALGLTITGFWLYSLADVIPKADNLDSALQGLPYFFALLWVCSTFTHAFLWYKQQCEENPHENW